MHFRLESWGSLLGLDGSNQQLLFEETRPQPCGNSPNVLWQPKLQEEMRRKEKRREMGSCGRFKARVQK